jgi:hypothetical protein
VARRPCGGHCPFIVPATDTLAYVEEVIEKQIKSYDSSRIFYRAVNNALTLATASLSALATVLIGVNQGWHSAWLSTPALVCSAAISVANAYEGFIRSKDMWILHDDTRIALSSLHNQILYAKKKSAPEPLNQVEVDTFFTQYDQLLLHEHEAWRALRTIRDQAHTLTPLQKS